MKKFQIISWIFVVLGISFKLLHYPGAPFIIMLGCLLLLIHGIIFLLKHAKTDLPGSFLHLSFTFWTIYLLFRIQYWSIGQPLFGFQVIFLIPLFITGCFFVLLMVKGIKFRLPQIILTGYFVFSLVLSYTPSYRVYYFVALNSTLNGERRDIDYHGWDKYSWFLYIANKPKEALEANEKAQTAVKNYLKIIQDEEALQFSECIKKHEGQITYNNWANYP